MKKPWPERRLGDALTPSEDWIEVQPDETYREVTVKLWGKGVIERGKTEGATISGTRRKRVRARQFILSRIDARNGALGLVPSALDGAIVSNDFPVFQVDESIILPEFLGWMSRTQGFVELCKQASEGTTNRVRLKEGRFLNLQLRFPDPPEQKRIVARIEETAKRLDGVRILREESRRLSRGALLSRFQQLILTAGWKPMSEVAPLRRRPLTLEPDREYLELGVRSFGNGTFHKKGTTGFELGNKKMFRIEPGDLLFNIVFAWEGAVAVAKAEDKGRVGSHRFLTCVPVRGQATAEFLRFYFLTAQGLEQLGKASPGGAGRNRTLSVDALGLLTVPVIDYDEQLEFDDLQAKFEQIGRHATESDHEIEGLMPAVLARAFAGEL